MVDIIDISNLSWYKHFSEQLLMNIFIISPQRHTSGETTQESIEVPKNQVIQEQIAKMGESSSDSGRKGRDLGMMKLAGGPIARNNPKFPWSKMFLKSVV